MVSATRWAENKALEPADPYQRLRWFPTFPSDGGGYSTFGWSPKPLDASISVYGGLPSGGISGVLPSTSQAARVIGAIFGIGVGFWLAKKNLS